MAKGPAWALPWRGARWPAGKARRSARMAGGNAGGTLRGPRRLAAASSARNNDSCTLKDCASACESASPSSRFRMGKPDMARADVAGKIRSGESDSRVFEGLPGPSDGKQDSKAACERATGRMPEMPPGPFCWRRWTLRLWQVVSDAGADFSKDVVRHQREEPGWPRELAGKPDRRAISRSASPAGGSCPLAARTNNW